MWKTALSQARAHARSRQAASLEKLKTFLRIPSVSTLPERRPDMQRAAEWVAEQLAGLGFREVAILPTGGHPAVYGEHPKAGPGAPTVLFYGHYDVQPADPVGEWTGDPFEPSVRGENLFARGASDMKGQIVAHLAAVESLLHAAGELPVRLKYLIEGEEEVGSPHMDLFLARERERLACDVCLNGDGGILGPDQPALVYGLRGLAYFELRLQGPARDLHSGTFGGAVANPAQALAKLIAGLHDAQGRITLPGFYERVRPLAAEERAELNRLPQGDPWWLQVTGAPALSGEEGYTAVERATARPSLDINGLLSGFTGAGAKTVLPAQAMAKLSFRLVPDQTPEEVGAALEEYIRKEAPAGVKWELTTMAGSRASLVERDSPAMRAAALALEKVWGKRPFYMRQGGSVPIVSFMQARLGVDSILMGFSLPDDNLHAPNEKLHLPTFYRGIEAFIAFMVLVGNKSSKNIQ
jgi:acetylornithine deacetylase/succinyl-diaminopimelate desuccinylase-like protein